MSVASSSFCMLAQLFVIMTPIARFRERPGTMGALLAPNCCPLAPKKRAIGTKSSDLGSISEPVGQRQSARPYTGGERHGRSVCGQLWLGIELQICRFGDFSVKNRVLISFFHLLAREIFSCATRLLPTRTSAHYVCAMSLAIEGLRRGTRKLSVASIKKKVWIDEKSISKLYF